MYKNLFLTFLTLIINISVFGQVNNPINELDKKLNVHFETYKAELYRYGGLTTYGETQSSFENKQIEQEISLFNEIKNSPLISNPNRTVFALCHNLLIHSPEIGKSFLILLNKPTKKDEQISGIMTEIIFSEEFGEQLALENLESNDLTWSKKWAEFLSKNAIYESSIPRIEKTLSKSKDKEINKSLLSALMYIGSPKSIKTVKQIIETTKEDEIQATAIFTLAELTGYEGIKYLEDIKTIGKVSKQERKSSIEWLKKETSPKNKYGVEVSNDISFINRFGDIKSPAITWLDKEGLLVEQQAENPKLLPKEKKEQILDLLITGKGFGLEAVKAQLFMSIENSDIDKLLLLRKACFYSPNNFTNGRTKTLVILIRYLRRTHQ